MARDVASDDVNEYLRAASGEDITAKDFRTWAGTVLAFRALGAVAPPDGERDARHEVAAAMRTTADRLGNTPAVARNSYVHPAVIDAYLDGSIGNALVAATEDAGEPTTIATEDEAAAVIALIDQRLRDDARRVRRPAKARRRQTSGRSR